MNKIIIITLVVFVALAQTQEEVRVAPYTFRGAHALPREKAPFFTGTAVTPDHKFKRISQSDYAGLFFFSFKFYIIFRKVCGSPVLPF